MPHVQPLNESNSPETSKELLSAIKARYGRVLSIFGTMAHLPDVLQGVININDGIHGDLPARLRELAYLKASQINNCSYCSHYHRAAAEQAGVTEEQIAAIDSHGDCGLFTALETDVLSYSEQLTRQADVDESIVDRLKAELSDTQLVALAATVALANFTNRFNHGLDVELP